jgi:cytochrome c-type biogenesis protein CcmH/NrfG
MSPRARPSVGLSFLVALLILTSCGKPGVRGDIAEPAAAPAATPSTVAPEEEIAQAREAIAADSLDAEAWFQLGVAWQDARAADPQVAPDSALVVFERLLARWPDHVKGLVHYGLTLEEARRFDEAAEQYRRAAELAPEDPRPLVNLGNLHYFQKKEVFEAKKAITRALELDPHNPEAHFTLGVLFADANMFSEASVEWNRVLDVAPGTRAAQLAAENLEKIRPLLEVQQPVGD